jgi:hypothetical protein
MDTSRPAVDPGRLWAGGAATALVAALITIVGILITRGVFDIFVLAPASAGALGGSATAWYAVLAAGAGLAATALVQLLIAFAPRPMRFFSWVMVLATAVAVLIPLVMDISTGAKAALALLNLILGLAIGSLVAGTAAAATRSSVRRDGLGV